MSTYVFLIILFDIKLGKMTDIRARLIVDGAVAGYYLAFGIVIQSSATNKNKLLNFNLELVLIHFNLNSIYLNLRASFQ